MCLWSYLESFNHNMCVCVCGLQNKQTGKEKPTSGVTLSPEQWALLCAGMPTLANALVSGDEGFKLQLGGSRRAYISKYR